MAGDQLDDVEELRALVGQLRTNLEARGRSGLVGVVVTKGPKAAPAPAAVPAAPVAAPAVEHAPQREHADAHAEGGEVAAPKAKTGKVGAEKLEHPMFD